jgi:hypothetical protein
MSIDNFYVVSALTNFQHSATRIRLFKTFMEHMDRCGAKLYIVEGVLDGQPFEVTSAENPRHIQVRLKSEIWYKENLINIGMSKLPADWQYVAWVDGDIEFLHPKWIENTVQELQCHPIVQMFVDAIDLGPKYEVLCVDKGFGYCYVNRDTYGEDFNKTVKETRINRTWHPGYCWAATREAIDLLGGLFDVGISGAADGCMARAFIGMADEYISEKAHPNYRKVLYDWQESASAFKQNIGYVAGSILHHWHGKKADRRYKERFNILIDTQFDPIADLSKDSSGAWVLAADKWLLRDQLREYFEGRNEDSVDV